jgi:hypothetical protein
MYANVVIETVKRAEDGDGVIVRLYETQRRRVGHYADDGVPASGRGAHESAGGGEVRPAGDGQHRALRHPPV